MNSMIFSPREFRRGKPRFVMGESLSTTQATRAIRAPPCVTEARTKISRLSHPVAAASCGPPSQQVGGVYRAGPAADAVVHPVGSVSRHEHSGESVRGQLPGVVGVDPQRASAWRLKNCWTLG